MLDTCPIDQLLPHYLTSSCLLALFASLLHPGLTMNVQPTLCLFIAEFINKSFQQGCFPSAAKSAIIVPVPKKPIVMWARHVSQVITWHVSQVIIAQYLILVSYLSCSSVQLTYNCVHIWVTAHCYRVPNQLIVVNILLRLQLSKYHHISLTLLVTLLGLFDIIAAFDRLITPIYKTALKLLFGIKCQNTWFSSNLTGRTVQVHWNKNNSANLNLFCGVP